jgi:hypothetical protein
VEPFHRGPAFHALLCQAASHRVGRNVIVRCLRRCVLDGR